MPALLIAVTIVWSSPASAESPAVPPGGTAVEIELADGTRFTGDVRSIDAAEVRADGAGGPRAFAVTDVRRIVRVDGEAAEARPAVTVIGSDGSRLTGDGFLWQGETATLQRAAATVRLPIERVRTVVLRSDTADAAPAWIAALPAEPGADIVVVTRGEGFELVECAIAEVAADTVTVVLDGERIPVRSGKVLGLSWVRPAVSAEGATQVTVAGGRIAARRVEWSPAELVLDGSVRLPGSMLRSIDYASGRTVDLMALTPERTTTEPFFAALAAEGRASFFGPRATVAAAGAAPAASGPPAGAAAALVVRPRTVVVWRVPPDSRRFRTRLRRSAGATGAVVVNVLLDDTTAFSERVGGAAADRGAGGGPGAPGRDDDGSVDLDVAGVRRLSIVVDFVPGDIGCPVRFEGAAFEK